MHNGTLRPIRSSLFFPLSQGLPLPLKYTGDDPLLIGWFEIKEFNAKVERLSIIVLGRRDPQNLAKYIKVNERRFGENEMGMNDLPRLGRL